MVLGRGHFSFGDNMVKLKVKPLYTKVVTKDMNIMRKIGRLLAIPQPGFWFSKAYINGHWDGRVRFFDYRSRKFLSGLLDVVVEHLEEQKIEFEVIMQYEVPEVVTDDWHVIDEDITLYDYQIEVIDECIEYGRGIISAATNAGKTEMATALYNAFQVPTLFLVNTKELFAQAVEKFEKRLKIDVGLINAKNWNPDPNGLTVAMVQTVFSRIEDPFQKLKKKTKSLAKKGDKMSLRQQQNFLEKQEKSRDIILEELKYVEMVFSDECHRASSMTWADVLEGIENAPLRFGLSGTPLDEDQDVKNHKLVGLTGMVIGEVTNRYLIDHGYSAPIEIIMVNYEHPELEDETWVDAYQELIVENDIRNDMIVRICEEHRKNNESVLVIIKHIDHGHIIKEMMEDEGLDVEFTHGSMSDEFRIDTLNDFKSGKLRLLIASTIFDEGIDAPILDVIVNAAGGKSPRTVLQRIGRVLRAREGKIARFYDFMDVHEFYTCSHTLRRYQTYKAEKFPIIKM